MDSYNSECNACITDKIESDRFSEPMVWIGIYIAVASGVCILAMAADLVHGFRNRKLWFPCKYFSLNAASITVITIAMKLPLDLTSPMPSYADQAAKVGSLAFMCVLMANLMPSLASMDNKTLLANIIALCILVITMVVNICIQINTGVIHNDVIIHRYEQVYYRFTIFACINTAMLLLLLMIMISSSLTFPTYKKVLEFKYRATNKSSLTDQHIQMSTVEKLRQHVRRYWVMAETGSPQFGMAGSPLSTASGVTCAVVLVINILTNFSVHGTQYLYDSKTNGSPYKWSATAILITQSIGIAVGFFASVIRSFPFHYLNMKNIMFFKVENYWIQKLHEWKESPVPFLSSNRRLRSLIYYSKNIFLDFFIWFQTVIISLCKLIWVIVTVPGLFLASCMLKHPRGIDNNLKMYVLQIDNDTYATAILLKIISRSMDSFISKAEKAQNNNLLDLLDKFREFDGVQIFDTDHVQSLLPTELVNSWSLPVVTLTCIAVSIPNIPEDTVKSLLSSVGEGLSFTHLVEEGLNCTSEYVNLRKASMSLWHEVEYKCKWLDNPLAKNVFDGKAATEIVKWFSDKAKEIVTEIKDSTSDGELVENPPGKLIAANSMYRITQTILLRFQSNTEPITKKQLFSHLNGMIADIFCACFTNLPRVITTRCHENVIEKREASVRVAAKLLGKTTKIIEKLEECDKVPSMDEDKMAYIDEWRLYMKQSIP
ncbi:hypothetical protein HanRHA438_Chr15g0688121 [Helianthus annuus]|uniref:Uncharacterized protein n=1 Tax=Helianthus annuus TaxID=4232 RepID=A0A251S9G7_HELAN|nr:uncharacterized protein LOC110910385 [Helianthus annuus]KAF5763041.1 hypothetical protein HanXRQr2_Chr15g0675711 [Helianthus annuus]KAJ0471739.1 hypothetical protein HanHA89_Chr15g0599391 [Helianthus annuus]KAJ0843141.1 hypothetical protein HanRHA438_Chr15g0688121 [Helianthus annuus]